VHCGIVERRLAMEVAARGEDEQGAPDRGVALLLRQRNPLAGDVRLDDEGDVGVSRSGTPLRSTRA
jgi:hypothetical protein